MRLLIYQSDETTGLFKGEVEVDESYFTSRREGKLRTAAESLVIQRLSKGKFSHLGVIVSVQPKVMIIHATTDDNPQQTNQVILSSYQQFSSKKLSQLTAIARPTFLTKVEKQKMIGYLYQQLGKKFRMAPINKKPLYCTTLIYDAIREVRHNFQLSWTHLKLPGVSGLYLTPEAFRRIPELNWL